MTPELRAEIDRNNDTFARLERGLLPACRGYYVLIRHGEHIGTYSDFDAALEATESYEDGLYSLPVVGRVVAGKGVTCPR